MRTFITISLVCLLSACGDLYVDGVKQGKDGSTTAAIEPEDGQTVKSQTVQPGTVSCEVTAKASAGQTVRELEWKISIARRSFMEIRDGAPEGWRLPTRGEVIDAFDAGQLQAFQAPNLLVWTSTEATDNRNNVYVVRLSDGFLLPYWKEALYSGLYVKE